MSLPRNESPRHLEVEHRWRLAELMAARGMRHSTDLSPLLVERGIVLSRPQVYRIVAQQPERLSLKLLAALCDILDCSSDDLLGLTTIPAGLPGRAGTPIDSGGGAAPPEDAAPPVGIGDVRRRLLSAMGECIDEYGYAATTVAHIVARARASRRTFYQVFSDREDCYVQLLTETNRQTIATIVAAVDPSAFWTVQVRQAIEAWIANTESRRALMLSWIRDVPALGASARPLRREAMEGFITMLQTLSNTDELRARGITPVSRQRAIMIIGGLRELTAMTVESGGRMSDIADEAVSTCIALGPVSVTD